MKQRQDPQPSEPEMFDETSDVIAFVWGFRDGARSLDPRPGKRQASLSNKVYYYPAYFLGYVFKIVMLILISAYGLGVSLPF